jgi:hypothetical protein
LDGGVHLTAPNFIFNQKEFVDMWSKAKLWRFVNFKENYDELHLNGGNQKTARCSSCKELDLAEPKHILSA